MYVGTVCLGILVPIIVFGTSYSFRLVLRMIGQKKRVGDGWRKMSTAKKLVGTIIHVHFCMTGKQSEWQMRWPSGPNVNKTRPHSGLFLHIKPYLIHDSYGDTHH